LIIDTSASDELQVEFLIFFSTVFFGGMFLVSQFQELLLLQFREDGEMARKLVGGAHEAHVL